MKNFLRFFIRQHDDFSSKNSNSKLAFKPNRLHCYLSQFWRYYSSLEPSINFFHKQRNTLNHELIQIFSIWSTTKALLRNHKKGSRGLTDRSYVTVLLVKKSSVQKSPQKLWFLVRCSPVEKSPEEFQTLQIRENCQIRAIYWESNLSTSWWVDVNYFRIKQPDSYMINI